MNTDCQCCPSTGSIATDPDLPFTTSSKATYGPRGIAL